MEEDEEVRKGKERRDGLELEEDGRDEKGLEEISPEEKR
jgi:hypothetical protein